MKLADTSRLKALIALSFAEIFWGMMAPIGKAAMDAGISSLTLTLLRILGATLCFWLIGLIGPKEHIKKQDYIKLFFAGMFYIVLNQGSYVIGLSFTSPIDASVICTSLPLVTLLLSYFIFKEKIGFKKIAGVITGGVGAIVLITSNLKGTATDSSVGGNLIVLCSQISVGIYLVLFRNLIIRYHVFTLIKWMFLFSSLVFTPIAAPDLLNDLRNSFSLAVWLNVAYVVLFGTVMSYVLIIFAQKTLKPAVVSIFNYIQPLVATILALLIGNGVLSWIKLIAIILIIVGVTIVSVLATSDL